MQEERVGVMVARGDMALELGYARLAEAQEEILWVCEAALVPVIWATQVLESLNKRGVPSRAEVTDAAMSGRAECVMLNQGAHVVEAVGFLAGVLDRMQDHQEKKSSLLRRLSISNVARHRSPSSSGAPPSS
jgi:pyruvate kinase